MGDAAKREAVPESLEHWTYETVERLAALGENESDRHDFKRIAKPTANDIAPDACAFANARGGYLVFGVAEDGNGWRVEGVKPNTELGADLHNVLKVTPSIILPPPKPIPIPDSKKLVYIVEVPEGTTKPYVPIAPHGEPTRFYKRVGGTNTHMTLEEIRLHMTDTHRKRTALRVLVHELQQNLLMLRAFTYPSSEELCLDLMDVAAIDRVLTDAFDLIADNAQIQQELYGLRRQLLAFNEERKQVIRALHAGVDTTPSRKHKGNELSAKRVRGLQDRIAVVGALLESMYGIDGARAALKVQG